MTVQREEDTAGQKKRSVVAQYNFYIHMLPFWCGAGCVSMISRAPYEADEKTA